MRRSPCLPLRPQRHHIRPVAAGSAGYRAPNMPVRRKGRQAPTAPSRLGPCGPSPMGSKPDGNEAPPAGIARPSRLQAGLAVTATRVVVEQRVIAETARQVGVTLAAGGRPGRLGNRSNTTYRFPRISTESPGLGSARRFTARLVMGSAVTQARDCRRTDTCRRHSPGRVAASSAEPRRP